MCKEVKMPEGYHKSNEPPKNLLVWESPKLKREKVKSHLSSATVPKQDKQDKEP